MTDIVDELKWRGLWALSTDEDALRKALADGPVTFYCGFDPTAAASTSATWCRSSPCAGSSRRACARWPWWAGRTGQIGDPRPTAERTLNDPETVESRTGWPGCAGRSSRSCPSRARTRR
ncbi:hypothetical protein SALBM311S_09756 [Streptomyces alboniger]